MPFLYKGKSNTKNMRSFLLSIIKKYLDAYLLGKNVVVILLDQYCYRHIYINNN